MMFLSFLSLLGVAAAQAPNTLAVYNQGLRTASLNASYTILAVPKSNVAQLVGSYDLLDVPSDTSLFPQGFPADKHPVLVSSGFQNDIRITVANGTLLPLPLQIQSLLSAQIYIPYVDRLKDGKSAFLYSVQNYIGGIDGDIAMALVPALVGSLAGTLAVPAVFDPESAAYDVDPTGEHTSLVKQNLGLYNSISGPSLQGEAADLYTNSTPTAQYTPHAFHALYNQPLILSGALSTMCLRNNLYFNDTRFMEPRLRTTQVTFGAAPVIPKALDSQVYDGQGAYEAVAQIVGQNPEQCEEAFERNDAFASE